MYAQIVAMLFPIYLGACLFALSVSWERRSAYLSFSYLSIYGIFQLFITGRAAEFGGLTFLYCAYVQLLIGLIALVCNTRASRIIARGAAAAVAANGIEAIAFSMHHPLRTFYFVGINTIQTAQILTLIACGPAWPILGRFLFTNRIRSIPWLVMLDSGPI